MRALLLALAASGCALIDASGDPHGSVGGSYHLSNIMGASGHPQDSVIANLNGDGIPDVVVLGETGEVYPCIGVGDGTFGATMPFQAGSNQLIAVGNLDADPESEIVVVGDGTLKVLDPTPGGFTITDLSPIAGGKPVAIAIGDFGNNPQTIVIGIQGSKDLTLVANALTTANRLPPLTMPTAMQSPDQILLATGRTKTQDSSDELVAAVGTTNQLFEIQNPAAAAIVTTRDLPQGGQLQAMVVGRFRDTPTPDLAYAVINNGGNSDNINILIGSEAGLENTGTPFGTGASAQAMGAADFDGDGLDDIAILEVDGQNSRRIRVFLQRPNDSFVESPAIEVAGHPGRVTFGDLNGDGKADILLGQDDVARGGLDLLLSN